MTLPVPLANAVTLFGVTSDRAPSPQLVGGYALHRLKGFRAEESGRPVCQG